jgi:hypothetical protein
MAEFSHQTARLSRGKHRFPDEGTCVMELASMLAGESFTDRPRAVCPVIATVLRSYNDAVDDVRRQALYRYASESVGTNDRALRRRRLQMAERYLGIPIRRPKRPFVGWRIVSVGQAVFARARSLSVGEHAAFMRFLDEVIAVAEPIHDASRDAANTLYAA